MCPSNTDSLRGCSGAVGLKHRVLQQKVRRLCSAWRGDDSRKTFLLSTSTQWEDVKNKELNSPQRFVVTGIGATGTSCKVGNSS